MGLPFERTWQAGSNYVKLVIKKERKKEVACLDIDNYTDILIH